MLFLLLLLLLLLLPVRDVSPLSLLSLLSSPLSLLSSLLLLLVAAPSLFLLLLLLLLLFLPLPVRDSDACIDVSLQSLLSLLLLSSLLLLLVAAPSLFLLLLLLLLLLLPVRDSDACLDVSLLLPLFTTTSLPFIFSSLIMTADGIEMPPAASSVSVSLFAVPASPTLPSIEPSTCSNFIDTSLEPRCLPFDSIVVSRFFDLFLRATSSLTRLFLNLFFFFSLCFSEFIVPSSLYVTLGLINCINCA